jgi:hypothetical protein
LSPSGDCIFHALTRDHFIKTDSDVDVRVGFFVGKASVFHEKTQKYPPDFSKTALFRAFSVFGRNVAI